MKIINVMAASLDGKIASHQFENDRERRGYGFSSAEDHEFVREQIKGCDAIITGANSMRASQSAWNQTGRDGKYPLWVVFSNQGLSSDLAFWQQTQIPRWLVSQAPLLIPQELKNNFENFSYGKLNPANFIFTKLKDLGMQKVLLFGGGEINFLFYEAGLVNELKITICPLLIAQKDAPPLISPKLSKPVNFSLLSSNAVGNHVFLTYSIQKHSS